MNKWAMAAVAVVAVLLAVVAVRPPDTGPPPPVAGPAPRPPPVPPPAAPPADRSSRLGAGTIERPPTEGSAREQLDNPSTPDDVRAAAAVWADWAKIARRLAYTKDAPVAWAAVEGDAALLTDQLKAFRADPTTADWQTLKATQIALIGRIRAAQPDAEIGAALDAIEAELAKGA